MKIDLPLPPETIELVDVGASQEGLKRLINFAELESLLQYAVLVDVHEELRHSRAESGDQRSKFRSFPRGQCQFVHGFGQLLNRPAAPVLQHEGEPTSSAEARNSRRAERESNGFRNLATHFLIQGLNEPISGKLRGSTLFPRLKLEKVETGVRGRGVGEQAETRNPAETLNAVRVRQQGINLAHDCIGALQRSGVRQLYLEERVSLILLRDETGGKALAHKPGNNSDAYEHEHCHDPPTNEDVAPTDVATCDFIEPAVKPTEELSKRATGFLAVTQQESGECRRESQCVKGRDQH